MKRILSILISLLALLPIHAQTEDDARIGQCLNTSDCRTAIIATIISIPFLVFGLSGLGDDLIGPKNPEEREQYDIKRLRLIKSAMILLLIIYSWIPVLLDNQRSIIYVYIASIPICFIGIILADTWAKKK